jgi:hypothetical protein
MTRNSHVAGPFASILNTIAPHVRPVHIDEAQMERDLASGPDEPEGASTLARRVVTQFMEYYGTFPHAENLIDDLAFEISLLQIRTADCVAKQPPTLAEAWAIVRSWLDGVKSEEESFSRYRDDVILDGVMTAGECRDLRAALAGRADSSTVHSKED